MVGFAIGSGNLCFHRLYFDGKNKELPSALPSLFLADFTHKNVILELV
jgi:hypothetical protein